MDKERFARLTTFEQELEEYEHGTNPLDGFQIVDYCCQTNGMFRKVPVKRKVVA